MSECEHQWMDYGTLKVGDNPRIEVEACSRCGVERKKQSAQPQRSEHSWGTWDGDRRCKWCGTHYTEKHLPCKPPATERCELCGGEEHEHKKVWDHSFKPPTSQRPPRNCGENAGEWTPETVEEMFLRGTYSLTRFYKLVADAHNAELAADAAYADQRQCFKWMEQQRNELAQQLAAEREKADWLWSVIKKVEGGVSLAQQLAAEREQVKHYEAANKTLLELAADDKKQLLAAQATIAAIIEQAKQTAGMNWLVKYLENPDNFKDALDRHDAEVRRPLAEALAHQDKRDAEVRKPLVDALIKALPLLELLKTHESDLVINEADDALAKVKSYPLPDSRTK